VALVEMARERRVETPIAVAVDAILAGRMSVEAAVDALPMRPPRAEA
jgi:glycerol-3-phosphate dehydrogenase (NAD(P)+)